MRRTATLLAAAAMLIVALGAGAYLYGGPTAPAPPPPGEPAAAPEPMLLSGPLREAATGAAAPAAGEEGPWFGIPGCTCHSDDPGVVEEHRAYRLQDCARCH